jgi:hypothetical protein
MSPADQVCAICDGSIRPGDPTGVLCDKTARRGVIHLTCWLERYVRVSATLRNEEGSTLDDRPPES